MIERYNSIVPEETKQYIAAFLEKYAGEDEYHADAVNMAKVDIVKQLELSSFFSFNLNSLQLEEMFEFFYEDHIQYLIGEPEEVEYRTFYPKF